MSTRGSIAIPDDLGWTGRYNHFDSYPSGLGRDLWHAYHTDYGGDLDRMIAEQVTDHPEEIRETCRCGLPGAHEADTDCAPLFIEYAYVLTPDGMEVWYHDIDHGHPHTEVYDRGPYTRNGYRHVRWGLVRWADPEPDWDAIEADIDRRRMAAEQEAIS